MAPSSDRALDESGLLEDFHMFRSARQGHRQRLGQFPDGQFAEREPAEHLAPARMRQRVEHAVNIDLKFNHMVENISWVEFVNLLVECWRESNRHSGRGVARQMFHETASAGGRIRHSARLR